MHEFLEGTVEGVTADQARWQPPGLAHTIGATYAHVVFTEDAVVNAVVRGAAAAGRSLGRVGWPRAGGRRDHARVR
jgi:hypothetical protein